MKNFFDVHFVFVWWRLSEKCCKDRVAHQPHLKIQKCKYIRILNIFCTCCCHEFNFHMMVICTLNGSCLPRNFWVSTMLKLHFKMHRQELEAYAHLVSGCLPGLYPWHRVTKRGFNLNISSSCIEKEKKNIFHYDWKKGGGWTCASFDLEVEWGNDDSLVQVCLVKTVTGFFRAVSILTISIHEKTLIFRCGIVIRLGSSCQELLIYFIKIKKNDSNKVFFLKKIKNTF